MQPSVKRIPSIIAFARKDKTVSHIQKRYHPVTPEDEEILLRDNNVPQYKNNSDYKTNCKAETPTKRLCESLFSFERFYFFLRYGIAYVDHPNGLQKHVMRYPQVFATKAIGTPP